jgi:homoserine O-acetyltransferase/O-succinyltransferase
MSRHDYEVFELGDLVLQRGATLRGARLAYTTYGTLAADRRNAVLHPTWYSGRHRENEWLIGPGMALDPARWFIIIPNMLGNGLSSSPRSNSPPYDRARFPEVTVHDNVEAQHRLVTQRFGIEHLACVTGWSMGAGQAFQWAVSHPEMVSKILPFCGSARTSEYNRVFLEGVKAALTADDAFQGGWYDRQPTKGLRAAARVYAGWGFSQAFCWQGVYRELGFSSLEDFLVGYWEGFFLDGRAQQPAHQAPDLAARRRQRDTGLRRRPRPRARVDHRTGHRHAGREGLALPAGGRGVRGLAHAQRRAPRHARGLGSLCDGGTNPEDTAFIDRALAELLAE